MSFNSKYTGQQVETLLDQVNNGEVGGNSAYPIEFHGSNDTIFEITPNIYHVWDLVTSLTLTLAPETDSSVCNEYVFEFSSGSTATTLSLPSTIKWVNAPNIKTGVTYQVSIVNGLGVIAGFSA